MARSRVTHACILFKIQFSIWCHYSVIAILHEAMRDTVPLFLSEIVAPFPQTDSDPGSTIQLDTIRESHESVI